MDLITIIPWDNIHQYKNQIVGTARVVAKPTAHVPPSILKYNHSFVLL